MGRFLKLEEPETEISTESDNKCNKSWIKAAKDSGRWTLSGNDYTKTAEERSENNARHRRNPQSRPARYGNWVRLSDDEVANITRHTVSVSTKKCSKVKILRNLESSSSSFASHTLQAQTKVREEVWSRTSWWIVDPELRDGLSNAKENYLEKELLGRSRYDWEQPRRDQDGIGKHLRHRFRYKRDGHHRHSSDWWTAVPATLFFCCLPGFLAPFVVLHRIRGCPRFSNSVNLYQQQPVFDSFLLAFVFDVTTHCHQQCASTHLANSASPISFNRLFFVWSWPFHSCL